MNDRHIFHLGNAALLCFIAFMLQGSNSRALHAAELTEQLREFEANVLNVEGKTSNEERDRLRGMLSEDYRNRRHELNVQDVRTWRSIKNVNDWEKLRYERLQALRESLGSFSEPPTDLNIRTTRIIDGDGFRIECLVFETRPGFLVTANLYVPSTPIDSMPGILICHSHHNPKTQRELQDMGMTWARQGCVVLVMDQLGHGERRQHPFRTEADYDKSFRVSRQDYYFRYNVGIQLHLVGESLIGWMAWDLMRGVDLLLARPGIDQERIILLGAVAGGGDPTAVTGALDRRIAAVVPFNFGGPQPESIYPLPEDAELSFNYMGGGSWESTRNLRLSGRDGFFPWLLVAAIAPRKLIYAHEFKWDRPHDPAWKRLERIYGTMYSVPDSLSSVVGYGKVTLSSAEASHCNNIGPVHRKQIYPAFEKWFDMEPPAEEYRNPIDARKIWCVQDVPAAKKISLTPVHQLATIIADQQIAKFRKSLAGKTQAEKRNTLRKQWTELLGDVKPYSPQQGKEERQQLNDGITAIKFVMSGEREILIPSILLLPRQSKEKPVSVIIGLAQAGKKAFLEERSEAIASLLKQGVAVCLPDLRGTGETRPGTYRGRRSYATGLSSGELMLGQTLVGSRLKDLRSLLQLLRSRDDIDGQRIAVWGESFAQPNAENQNVAVPLRIDDEPDHSEPLAPLLALLAGVFENKLAAVVSGKGGMAGFRSALSSPFVYFPHDFVIPGALTAGDFDDLAESLAPTPLWIGPLVDGVNKSVSDETARKAFTKTLQAYGSGDEMFFAAGNDSKSSPALEKWIAKQLQQ